MEEVYSFLKENMDIKETDYFVVGVSGGADSMALLDILRDYFHESKCQIVCAHVHHNLRKESDEEQIFVKNYCHENHLLFETVKLEYEGKFTEKEGREKRYSFFEQVLKKYHSKYLFTAHHGDDLVETILMRMGRGSTLKGMCGISKTSNRKFYTIIRPLLFLNKEEIYQYVKERNIPYVEDCSNQDIHYTRNRYRKELLPFLKKENSKVHLNFLHYSENLEEVLDYLDRNVEKEYNRIVNENQLNWILWKKLDSLFQKEILKKYLFNIYQDKIDCISSVHLKIFMNFLQNGKVNTSICFPMDYSFYKGYQEVEVKKEKEKEEYFLPIEKKVSIPNNHTLEILSMSDENSNYVTYLDSSMLQLPLFVRNYKEGDRMSIKNMLGHKKVGDIFTNEKISIEDRKMWPVVIDQTGTIIWLPGLKKTQFDRKKDGIYDIILKYY